jgi:hypothetical protein
MLGASLVAIFLVPVSFYVVEKLSRRREPHPVTLAYGPMTVEGEARGGG